MASLTFAMQPVERQKQASWRRPLALSGLLAMLALGGLEDWFGKTDSGDLFGSDAVQYLDCARAIGRRDWRSALNPLWSQGYPALLAAARPMFPRGMEGDWLTVRAVNFGVYCFVLLTFSYLVRGVVRDRPLAGRASFAAASACVFLSTQLCLGQVSRVGPDELVAGFFFLACGLMLRILQDDTRPAGRGAALGAVLGLGFLVKAAFLPLGCGMLAVLAMARWRRGLRAVLPGAAAVFGVLVLGYGAALSHAVGYRTLGESGSLNYAWHVDRLSKWVHWEGGVESADQAWPKPWMARFVQWDRQPPDFGMPMHPSARMGRQPTVYVFQEPVVASYVPYYDPAYWYRGYRHVFHWRYQAIALGKNVGDLVKVLAMQGMVWAVLIAMGLLHFRRKEKVGEPLRAVAACAALGVVLYLPVHLEGRYLSGFLAALGLAGLVRLTQAEARTRRAVLALALAGLAVDLGRMQRVVWSRAAHGWSYRDNAEWRVAQGLGAIGLPRGSAVGMISWTPNLHCDWAYLAGLRITSEIASGQDERAFWGLAPDRRTKVMDRFRAAGARAVLSWERPPLGAAGWVPVGSSGMWMYRFPG